MQVDERRYGVVVGRERYARRYGLETRGTGREGPVQRGYLLWAWLAVN